MKIQKSFIVMIGVLGLAVQLLDPSTAVAKNCPPAGSHGCQNMQAATQAHQSIESNDEPLNEAVFEEFHQVGPH